MGIVLDTIMLIGEIPSEDRQKSNSTKSFCQLSVSRLNTESTTRLLESNNSMMFP